MIQDAAVVAIRDRNSGRTKRTFVKLTMSLCCDIVADMRSLSLGAMNLSPALCPISVFWDFSPTKTAGNSEITADAGAVLAFTKLSAAQDFRGEGGVGG